MQARRWLHEGCVETTCHSMRWHLRRPPDGAAPAIPLPNRRTDPPCRRAPISPFFQKHFGANPNGELPGPTRRVVSLHFPLPSYPPRPSMLTIGKLKEKGTDARATVEDYRVARCTFARRFETALVLATPSSDCSLKQVHTRMNRCWSTLLRIAPMRRSISMARGTIQHAARCTLHAARCTLHAACCTLHAACCMLQV